MAMSYNLDTLCLRKLLSSTAKEQDATNGSEENGVLSGDTNNMPHAPLGTCQIDGEPNTKVFPAKLSLKLVTLILHQ
jgi:hypothetical protein